MSNQTTDLKITPKRLGLICVRDYCPKCYWYLLKQKFHPPFDIFGGAVFIQMEQAEIAVVAHLLATNGALPKEFEPFSDLVSQVEFPRDWRKFQHRLKSGALLYGEPDDICKFADHSLAIIDHKTADPKDGEDPLLACYRCQVTGYGLIAEKGLGLGEVATAGLFYWSANHKAVVGDPGAFYDRKGLWMPFAIKPVAIDIDYSILDAPLKEAVKLWESSTPPEGREKCKDCRKLEALFAIRAEVESLLSCRDQQMLASSGYSLWTLKAILNRRSREDQKRFQALYDLRDEANQIEFADDGMILNWENYHDGLTAVPMPRADL